MDFLTLLDYRLNITVVEDDVIILKDIRYMLERLGHNVIAEFKSGEEVLMNLPLSKTDILILDIELQGNINGIQVATELQKIKRLPLIYMTSYSDEKTLRNILQTDPYGFILKPAKRDELNIAINIAYYKFISDRKLLESEKRYQSIVETLPLMIARISPIDERITYCNGMFVKWFYGETEDSQSKGALFFFELMSVNGLNGLMDFFIALDEKNSSSVHEIEISEAAGKGNKWYKIICQALFDNDGILFEYQFICEDITERKENERQVREKTVELDSRVRDLKCLYSLSSMQDGYRSLEKMLQRAVDEISIAFNDSDNISACIEYGDRCFYSYNYFTSPLNYNNPIIVENSMVGNLKINISEAKGSISFLEEEEYDLITAVTDQINKALYKYESVTQLKKLEREIIMISEREKQRLGHELHDGIGQILTGASFILKTLEKKLDAKEITMQEVSDVGDLLRDATSRCRRLSKGLVPVSYNNETFAYLIEQLMHSTKQFFNIGFVSEIPEHLVINNSFVTSQIFRIIQEAVNNIVKHANATEIILTLHKEDEFMRFAVTDNGVGFSGNRLDGGLGMSIMKYRSDLIGAEFDIISEEGKGTTVMVRVPLDHISFKTENE